MTTATAPRNGDRYSEPPTLDDLVERLGGIPLSRILVEPAPGTATEADVLEAERRYDRLYELVDGVLVEKAMGYQGIAPGGCIDRDPEELRGPPKPWSCLGARRHGPPFSRPRSDSRRCVRLVGPLSRSQDPEGADPFARSRPRDRSVESNRTHGPRWNASAANTFASGVRARLGGRS